MDIEETFKMGVSILAGIGATVGLMYLVSLARPSRTKENPSLVVIGNSEIRNFSEHPKTAYIDEAPFGSLNYVVDYSSGERVQREPTTQEHTQFGRLEQEAMTRGHIIKK